MEGEVLEYCKCKRVIVQEPYQVMSSKMTSFSAVKIQKIHQKDVVSWHFCRKFTDSFIQHSQVKCVHV